MAKGGQFEMAKLGYFNMGERGQLSWVFHLLIIDDFGIQPFDQGSRACLLEIIEDRHGKRSTIITSQLPVKQWHDVIGEKTIADAVMDRIVHNAQRVELKGESLRRRWNKKSTENN